MASIKSSFASSIAAMWLRLAKEFINPAAFADEAGDVFTPTPLGPQLVEQLDPRYVLAMMDAHQDVLRAVMVGIDEFIELNNGADTALAFCSVLDTYLEVTKSRKSDAFQLSKTVMAGDRACSLDNIMTFIGELLEEDTRHGGRPMSQPAAPQPAEKPAAAPQVFKRTSFATA